MITLYTKTACNNFFVTVNETEYELENIVLLEEGIEIFASQSGWFVPLKGTNNPHKQLSFDGNLVVIDTPEELRVTDVFRNVHLHELSNNIPQSDSFLALSRVSTRRKYYTLYLHASVSIERRKHVHSFGLSKTFVDVYNIQAKEGLVTTFDIYSRTFE